MKLSKNPVRISFARPEGGMALSLTLHQNGKDMPGKRLP